MHHWWVMVVFILLAWMAVSVTVSMLVGALIAGPRPTPQPELVGMDGDLATYRLADGRLVGVSLA